MGCGAEDGDVARIRLRDVPGQKTQVSFPKL
jgi:hypothetical protein